MKKYIFRTLLVASLAVVSSCDSYFDSDSKSEAPAEEVFSKVSTTEGMIAGIYHYFGEQNSYRSRLISYMGINSDCEMHSGSSIASASAQDRKTMAVYLQTAALSDGFDKDSGAEPWSYLYGAIEQANICIDGIRHYGNYENNEQMAQFLGEALTLRAFFYFDLIKYWGDVPARFEPVSVSNVYLAKSDRTVIYTQILEDLREAEELLPWANDANQTATVERVSKGFAKGLRARIALNAAGKALVRTNRTPLVYTEGGDAGVIDYVFTESAKRENMYQIVIDECSAVIASGKNKLASNFEDIWVAVMNDEVAAGGENLFEIPFAPGRGQHAVLLGAAHDEVTKYVTKAVAPYVVAVPSFFYDYSSKDTRRDVTLMPYKYVRSSRILESEGADTKNGFQDLSDIAHIYFGKYRASYRDVNTLGKLGNSSVDCGINFPVLRMADIYLMLAEAINEKEGPANAKQYLKAVRERAFKSADGRFDLIPYNLDTHDGFLQAIQDERKFEFANELIRKQDLIRWGILKENLDKARQDIRDLRDHKGNYTDVPSFLWYRMADSENLEIRGLNADDDMSDCSLLNGWHKKLWTIAEDYDDNGDPAYVLNDQWINLTIYQGDPDKRQLLPIVTRILNGSQNTLVNDYGY